MSRASRAEGNSAGIGGMTQANWTEGGAARTAGWLNEYGAAPRRILVMDDNTPADAAFREATQGTALLWRGDYHNARQLLQALGRRIDERQRRTRQRQAVDVETAGVDAFNRHRLLQSQRAQLLNRLLVELTPQAAEPYINQTEASGAQVSRTKASNARSATAWVLHLRRAPDIDAAVQAALGSAGGPVLLPLRALLGYIGAWEWRRQGVQVPGLAGRIHVHYGVFSPNRGEYLDLVAQAPLPANRSLAFDVGTGSGVLAAILASRGIERVIATDQDQRALACAADNIAHLGLQTRITLLKADLFPLGRSPLIVCNPPWLPARPTTSIEQALYDPGSRMLLGYLRGLPGHLDDDGEGWLIMSDLAEHLGLREASFLLEAIAAAGLRVLDRLDTRPRHAKAMDEKDPLYAARRAEVTSLWRLGQA